MSHLTVGLIHILPSLEEILYSSFEFVQFFSLPPYFPMPNKPTPKESTSCFLCSNSHTHVSYIIKLVVVCLQVTPTFHHSLYPQQYTHHTLQTFTHDTMIHQLHSPTTIVVKKKVPTLSSSRHHLRLRLRRRRRRLDDALHLRHLNREPMNLIHPRVTPILLLRRINSPKRPPHSTVTLEP